MTALPHLESIAGFVAEGDVLGVNWAIDEGTEPIVVNALDWPLPPGFTSGEGPERIGITDELLPIRAGIALLRPPSLVIGINPAPDADPDEVHGLLIDTLAAAGLSRSSVATIATLDRYTDHPALQALGHPIRGFPARHLHGVMVPNPSEELWDSLGTASVCEAAAITAGGNGGRLLVSKRWNGAATLAVVRRRSPSDVTVEPLTRPANEPG